MREFVEFREGLRREILFPLTENCNLDCVYCYEKHKNGRALSAEFIKQAITKEMLADDPCKLKALVFSAVNHC